MKQSHSSDAMNWVTICLTAFSALFVMTAALIPWPNAEACSRILWNDNKLAVVVARTMDWPETTEPILAVFPRGVQRDGDRAGSQVVVKENAARWVSKYGSMIIQVYGIGTSDGFN